MAWCPKCKLEYREGIAVCADCNTPLVSEEELAEEKVLLCSYEKEEVLIQINEFLIFSRVESGEISFGTEIVDGEEVEGWHLKVAKADVKKAVKFYQAFMLGEMDRKKELDEITVKAEETLLSREAGEMDAEEAAEKEEASQPKETDAAQEYLNKKLELDEQNRKLRTGQDAAYVKQEDRYKDYNSTGYTFLLIGLAGTVVMVLSWIRVFRFFQGNMIAQVVFTAISIGCVIIGIQSLGKARCLKKEIGSENELTNRINSWIAANISKDELEEITKEDASEEIKFLNQIAFIKQQVSEEFGDENDAYLDQLIEEYYNEHF